MAVGKFLEAGDTEEADRILISNGDFSGSAWKGVRFKNSVGAADGGMYEGTDNVLYIQSGGSGRIALTGAVGVKTATPGADLEVVGFLRVSSPTGNADIQMNSATRPTIYPYGPNVPANLDFQIKSAGGGSLQLNQDNTGPVSIRGGALYVAGGGNVGIGTTNPGSTLEVNGPIEITNLRFIQGFKYWRFGDTNAKLLAKRTSSNGAATKTIRLWLYTPFDYASVDWKYHYSDDPRWTINQSPPDAGTTEPSGVVPNYHGDELLAIDGGNVGIDKTPTEKLDVNGNIKLKGAGTGTTLKNPVSNYLEIEGLRIPADGQTVVPDGVSNGLLRVSCSRTGGISIKNAQPGGYLFEGFDGTEQKVFGVGAAGDLTVSGKGRVGNPAGSTGSVNLASAGVYAWRDATRYINIRANGDGNDLESQGAPLFINYLSGEPVEIGTNVAVDFKVNNGKLMVDKANGDTTLGGNLVLGGTRTLIDGFDGSIPYPHHWIRLNGPTDDGRLFIGLVKSQDGLTAEEVKVQPTLRIVSGSLYIGNVEAIGTDGIAKRARYA